MAPKTRATVSLFNFRTFILCTFVLLNFSTGLETRRSTANCLLPSSWWGLWFQKGINTYIRIDTINITIKGTCIATDGFSKYLFVDKRSEPCYRCLVINQNHLNIVQYRETHCYPHGTFRDLCSMINADQELYPMFRVNAEPISCPLKGPFTFTYSRSGKQICAEPVSRADVCTHDSKIILAFQSCTNVIGSQSSVETMTCVATWREGHVSYLIAKLDHEMVSTDNDRYRCFIFGKSQLTNKMIISQSEDATCNGLRELSDGDRIMNPESDDSLDADCEFPAWITKYQKWHQLSSNFTFIFTNSSFVAVKFLEQSDIPNEYSFRSTCLRNVSTSMYVFQAITHTVIGCDQLYTCISFLQRQKHILQITSGIPERKIENACRSHRKRSKKNTVFLAPVGKTMECSKINGRSIKTLYFEHQYSHDISNSLNKQCHKPSEIRLYCGSSTWMSVLHTDCKNGHIPNIILECHFIWKSNGSTYLITSSHDREIKYCFMFDESKKNLIIREGHHCRRNPRSNVSDVYKINHIEWCDNTNRGISQKFHLCGFLILISLWSAECALRIIVNFI